MNKQKEYLCITHRSTAKQEEEMKERGSCQTLDEIPELVFGMIII